MHPDAGVLAGCDEGIQLMAVHHAQHVAVMQRHLLSHPARKVASVGLMYSSTMWTCGLELCLQTAWSHVCRQPEVAISSSEIRLLHTHH